MNEKIKIGIVGLGYVGKAIQEFFKNKFEIYSYDIKEDSSCDSLDKVVENSNIIFLCLPTPMNLDGSASTIILEDVISEINTLCSNKELKTIVIKSTVPVGTTENLSLKYNNISLVFNPEFLTEANSIEDFKNLMKNDDTIILDVRDQKDFKNGFVPGSIFIGLNGAFAPWVGSIIKDVNKKLLLVCDPDSEKEAIMRLSRVGFDNCLGFLEGGFSTWSNNNSYDTIESIDSDNLSMIVDKVKLIDVRKLSERDNGFLSSSVSIPLDEFQEKLEQVNNNEKNYIHCAGGYRSMIACSILKRNGYKSVVDVKGGFSAIRNSNFKILTHE